MYRAVLSHRARRAFLALPTPQAPRVKATIEQRMQDPRGPGTIKLSHAPVADYRGRVGTWRIRFDIDDRAQIIEIVDISRAGRLRARPRRPCDRRRTPGRARPRRHPAP